MDPSKLDKETESMTEVVTRDKVDAVSAGIVKDDRSQKLSVLAETQDALGVRAARKGRKAKRRHQQVADRASDTFPESSSAEGVHTDAESSPEGGKALKTRQVLAARAVSELDDADELEGTQGAYDAGRTAKRISSAIRSR